MIPNNGGEFMRTTLYDASLQGPLKAAPPSGSVSDRPSFKSPRAQQNIHNGGFHGFNGVHPAYTENNPKFNPSKLHDFAPPSTNQPGRFNLVSKQPQQMFVLNSARHGADPREIAYYSTPQQQQQSAPLPLYFTPNNNNNMNMNMNMNHDYGNYDNSQYSLQQQQQQQQQQQYYNNNQFQFNGPPAFMEDGGIQLSDSQLK